MGELKKRLDEWNIHLIAKEIVKEWLDEARKDFPNFNKILKRYKSGEEWLPNDFPAFEFSRDVIKWFIEWMC